MTMLWFNENDPFPAAWLRNLFPEATVDERSIESLAPGDIPRAGRCHFFGGIGGWEYALRLAGWPDDWDVWSGSCPCQPFSQAGKRKGVEDERHLWPAWFRLIAECRPATIFGEQVAGIDGLSWISNVREDLESLGYAVGASDLPATSVGAPHVRHRLWFVGLRPDAIGSRREGGWKNTPRAFPQSEFAGLVQAALQSAVPTGRMRALADGVQQRTPKLRAYGNAIVPQVAAVFVRAAMEAMWET